jgi:hypothetical protein
MKPDLRRWAARTWATVAIDEDGHEVLAFFACPLLRGGQFAFWLGHVLRFPTIDSLN